MCNRWCFDNSTTAIAVAPFEIPIPSAPLPPRAPLAIILKHTKTKDRGFEIFYNRIFGSTIRTLKRKLLIGRVCCVRLTIAQQSKFTFSSLSLVSIIVLFSELT